MKMNYGAIEAGGTKFIVGCGSGPGDLSTAEIPTTTPEETLPRCIAWLHDRQPFAAIGIASFGPVDLDPASSRYGCITTTPKLLWRNTDLFGIIRKALNVRAAIDTDVNAAARAESKWGAAAPFRSCLYLTIGTGIGGGAHINGNTLKGLTHPEMGHIKVPRHQDDHFAGSCPFHQDCLEGLASGSAIEARWKAPAATLPPDHPAWEMQAHYLASAVANFICTLSPACVILGGGVMNQRHLFDPIGAKVAKLLNGYTKLPPILPPGLGKNSGIAGALALAQLRYDTRSPYVMEI